MFVLRFAMIVLGLAATAAGAGPVTPEKAAPWRVLVDDAGRTVVLPSAPLRIVSTAPSNTEALFALGAGDRVVGVTTLCVDPPEAKGRAKIGDFSTLDFEHILRLKPDLVVATWLEQRRAVEKLEGLGLRVLVLYPTTLEETLASMLTLGQALGAEELARAMIADMRRRLEVVDARVRLVPEAQRPRVFVELGRNPLYTAGPGSTVDEVITRAGGRNIASDLGKPYATISREAVMARDPQVVLLGMAEPAGTGAAAFVKEVGFGSLSAVRDRRVHDELDPAILFHQNHRLVEGVEQVCRLLLATEGAGRDSPPAAPMRQP